MFNLATADGAECMLQASNDTDAQTWMEALRAASLLRRAVGEIEDKAIKSKSFFGLGKKK